MTIDCVAYLLTYELHVLEIYVYGVSYAVLITVAIKTSHNRGWF